MLTVNCYQLRLLSTFSAVHTILLYIGYIKYSCLECTDTVYSMQYAVCGMPYTVCHMQYAVCSIQYAVWSM